MASAMADGSESALILIYYRLLAAIAAAADGSRSRPVVSYYLLAHLLPSLRAQSSDRRKTDDSSLGGKRACWGKSHKFLSPVEEVLDQVDRREEEGLQR